MLKFVWFFFAFFFLIPLVLGSFLGTSDSHETVVCGISPALSKYGKHSISQRMIHGKESVMGDWPWMISIKGNCGATLIGKRWALTAAHCAKVFTNETRLFVSTILEGEGIEIKLVNYIIHPGYLPEMGFVNDITLMEVANVTFTKDVIPICLTSMLTKKPRDNTICTGWGTTWNGQNITNTKNLREDLIPIRPLNHCKKALEEENINQTSTIVCAGNKLHSPFHGDSGGPLLEIFHDRFFQTGIVSTGDPSYPDQVTNRTDFEDIYTFVPAYCPWIEETTGGEVRCE